MHDVIYKLKSRWKDRSSPVFQGYRYASSREAATAVGLQEMKDNGEIKSWSRQPLVRLYIYGQYICDYKLDFEVIHNPDSRWERELIEVKKGMFGSEWRRKWKILEAVYTKEHPEVRLTLIR